MKKPISSKKVALLAVLTLVLIAALSFGIVSTCSKPQEKPQDTTKDLKAKLESEFERSSFDGEISIEIRTRENGTTYLVGILSQNLESKLSVLVDNYNADPTTDPYEHIDVDSLRLALTDDLEKTYQKRFTYPDYPGFRSLPGTPTEGPKYAVLEFIFWCNGEADLVYRWDDSHGSGSISNAGDDGPRNITNYEHSINKDDPNYDYCYRWKYEATQTEATQ